MSRVVSVLIGLLLLASATSAAVYRVVDEQGRVTFTDSPPEGAQAERLDLPALNTQEPVAVPEPVAAPAGEEDLEIVRLQPVRVDIVSPLDQTVIPAGQQSVPVQVSLSQPLEENGLVQILIDGRPVAMGPKTEFYLTDLTRGEFRLQARVIGQLNQVVASSKPITIFVQRPSLIPPGPAQPPQNPRPPGQPPQGQ